MYLYQMPDAKDDNQFHYSYETCLGQRNRFPKFPAYVFVGRNIESQMGRFILVKLECRTLKIPCSRMPYLLYQLTSFFKTHFSQSVSNTFSQLHFKKYISFNTRAAGYILVQVINFSKSFGQPKVNINLLSSHFYK